ncbi:hypothetical protein [Streptomyces sp. NPDC059909]|uniref:hypothetical protein n=1 Tax=Streptomyces sp. NPDC059909 TaxID=3346998 RepID=UPI00365AACB8
MPYPGEPESVSERTSLIDLSTLASEGFRFVLSLVLSEVGDASELDKGGQTIGCRLWGRDGSWAHVLGNVVRQGGPRRLWDAVEDSHLWFETHGRPSRDRFGVTITPAGQTFWLDEPRQYVPPAPSPRELRSA